MLQQAIIKQYHQVFQNRTYREIADHTGIQMTRVFRIFNGAPMKLCEYETLYQKIQERGAMGGRLCELAREVEKHLSANAILCLSRELERRLQIASLLQSTVTIQQSIA